MNDSERPEYLQRLFDLMGTPDIKIITGIRRYDIHRKKYLETSSA